MTVHRISQAVLEPDIVGESTHLISQAVLEVDADFVVDPIPPFGFPLGCAMEEEIITPEDFLQAPATKWQDDPRYTFWTEYPGHPSWFQNAAPGVLFDFNGFRFGGNGTVSANQHAGIQFTPAQIPSLSPGRRLEVRGIIRWSFYSSAVVQQTVRMWLVVNGHRLTTLPSAFPPSDPNPLPFTLVTFADALGNLNIHYGLYGDTGIGSLSLQAQLHEMSVWCLKEPESAYGYIMQHHA